MTGTTTSQTPSPQWSPTTLGKDKRTATGTPATVSTEASASPPSSHHGLTVRTDASVWMPRASPSRRRLDARYASRLTPRSTTSESMPPPPSSARVFRPSPILTTTPTAATTPNAFSSSPSTMRSFSSCSSASDQRMRQTPQSRPKRKPSSDRYIPNRGSSAFSFNLWDNKETSTSSSSSPPSEPASATGEASQPPSLLNTLLRSELLGENDNPDPTAATPGAMQVRSTDTALTPLPHRSNNLLSYKDPRQTYQDRVFDHGSFGSQAIVESFSLNPVKSAASQRLMAQPQKRKRRISKVPFKVLDAPALQDDFYLNLVDWSSQNVLAVALGSCVYLWSACTSQVTKLCDLSSTEDSVTAVSWAERGTHLAIGTNRGDVQLWDTIKGKKVRSMHGHSARVGTLAWKGPTLASGSRDRAIYLRDVRVEASFTEKLSNHRQEVCGLKWSFDDPGFLASGGNDNDLYVIDSRNPLHPVHKFSEHTAAVKAIAWSPHQHGLLASGGGTADRCIRFWNTLSGVALNKIDTGSQVCNISWSRNCNEIVSTHGYSLNQIIVWRYPNMSKVTTLTGHTFRVLYLAMSPDGSTVVTGAGDETLRFWQVFPGPQSDNGDSNGGLLFPNTPGSVIR